MTIRPFEARDRADFLEMAGEFYRMPAVLHEIDPAHFTRTFDEILAGSPLAGGVIAELDGKAAGYALLSFTWSNEAGGLVVLVEEVYVREAFRSHGIGQEIFRYLRRKYDGEACRYRLEVTRENPRAAKLYERLGYRELDYRQMVLDRPDFA